MKTKKRTPGEGTVYQLSDGRWRGVLSLGFVGGKRKYKTIEGQTSRDVEHRLTELKRNLNLGFKVTTEKMTLAQFFEKWFKDSAEPKVRPATMTFYRYLFTNHVEPELGSISLPKLTAVVIQGHLNQKKKSGLSGRTVQHIHGLLRVALERAVRFDLIHRNPAKLVDPPRAEKHEIVPFSPEQARTFLDVVKDDRLESLYAVAMSMGLRQGEAFGLQWDDIDFDRGTLSVRRALQRIEKIPTFIPVKAKKSRRTLVLPQVAVQSLVRHKSRQNDERLLAGDRWSKDWDEGNGLVFRSTIGTPLDNRNVTKGFQRFLKRHGLPRLRFHDLRHTAATLLLVQGVHPRLVMETLGHSQISLTMNTYSHVLPPMMKGVSDQMDTILNPVQGVVKGDLPNDDQTSQSNLLN